MKIKLTYFRSANVDGTVPFGGIFVRYFLLLLIGLVLPAVTINIWYGRQMHENSYAEMIRRNETSLTQACENVEAILKSAKNLAYSLSTDDNVRYLAYRSEIENDPNGVLHNLIGKLSVVKTSNE